MSDLLTAAKAVLDAKYFPQQREAINALRAAVEKIENPPANYNAWTARHSGKTVSPYELWTDAQLAERERLKTIILGMGKTLGITWTPEWIECVNLMMEKINE